MKLITAEQADKEGWYKPNRNNGMCECGCGEEAPIAKQSHRKMGHVKGEPMRYKPGHASLSALNKGNPNPPKGEEHWNWRGGTRNSRGYVEVFIPKDHPMAAMRAKSGYVREHRLAVATALGRPLESHEVVHHKNNVKHDNRLDNLELTTMRQNGDYRTQRARLAESLLKRFESDGLDPYRFIENGVCSV